MTYVEAVRAAAYGSAFSAELARCNHGREHTTHTKVGEHIETVRGTHDAREAAKRWATLAANLAVESLEGA